MQRIVLLVLLGLVATGCGFFRKTFGVSDPPAHTEAQTTSIWGDWVLASQADSTAFAGARDVELMLQPGTFRLRAVYPAGDVIVTGTARVTESGLLTLVPGSQTGGLAGTWRALTMRAGQPVSVLATSAGGSLVFAPDERSVRPSSVWHRRDAAERAGRVGETGAARPPDR